MTTVSIATYGGVADGVWVRQSLTVSGTNVSAPGAVSAVWAPGAATKSIAIGVAGGSPTEAGGGTSYTGTIQTVAGDGLSITVSPAVASSFTAQTVIASWGTDNQPAFEAFRVAFQGASGVVLNCPNTGTGVYHLKNQDPMFSGVTEMTMNLTGATIAGGAFRFGSAGQYQDNSASHNILFNTVAAGSNTITCKTHADAGYFTPGQWCLLTNGDLYGQGFPTSHAIFEYVKPIANNTGTGVVTLESPLTKSYYDYWPVYNDSAADLYAPNYGGPAMAYVFYPQWDHTFVCNGGTIACHQQQGSFGRSFTFNGTTFPSDWGPFPTMCQTYRLLGCSLPRNNMEVDKYVDAIDFTGSTFNAATHQSTSIHTTTVDNFTAVQLLGVGADTTITNSNVQHLLPRLSFGRIDRIRATNSVFDELEGSAVYDDGFSLGNCGVDKSYTMAGGIIKIPYKLNVSAISNQAGKIRLTVADSSRFINGNHAPILLSGITADSTPNVTFIANSVPQLTIVNSTTIDTDADYPPTTGPSALLSYVGGTVGQWFPLSWAIPGTWCMWSSDWASATRVFQVTDLYFDSNFVYVATTESGGFPPLLTALGSPLDTKIRISIHQAPRVTFTGCSGADGRAAGISGAPPDWPLWSYYHRIYTTGALAGGALPVYPLFGNLKSLEINVLQEYTGGGALQFYVSEKVLSRIYGIRSDQTTVDIHDISVNCVIPGKRTITLSGNSNAQSGDHMPTLDPLRCWLPTGTVVNGGQFSSDVSSTHPEVTVEVTWKLDQGITIPGNTNFSLLGGTLGMRLRA